MLKLGIDASLVQYLSDAVVIVGADGTIQLVNAPFQALSGQREPLAGRPVRELLPEWDEIPLACGPSGFARASLQQDPGPPRSVEVARSSWQAGNETRTGAIVRGVPSDSAPSPAEAPLPAALQAAVAYKLLEEVVEMLPQAICVFDSQDRYVLWNHRYADLYPEIADQLRVGMAFTDILRISFASGDMREKTDDFEQWLSQRLAKHALPSWREEQEFNNGRWILHDDRRLPSGGAVGMRIDITELKRRESSFRLLFKSNPVAMLIYECGTCRILDVNDAGCAFYGRTRNDILSLRMPDLHEGREQEAAAIVYQTVIETYEGRTVWHQQTADGVIVNVLLFIRASAYQERPSFLAAVVDVSDRIRAEARIAHIAHHDLVTGLPNRVRFRDVAQNALCMDGFAAAERRLIIYCLDLDGFKPVNDTYGHGIGDVLLKMSGERFRAAVHDCDLVARLGGDEFAVLQTTGWSDPANVAARLVACMADPFVIEGRFIRIGLSVGFAVTPMDGRDLDQLMLAADRALYAAKAAGRGTWRAANHTSRSEIPDAPPPATTTRPCPPLSRVTVPAYKIICPEAGPG